MIWLKHWWSFENIWRDRNINLTSWLKQYAAFMELWLGPGDELMRQYVMLSDQFITPWVWLDAPFMTLWVRRGDQTDIMCESGWSLYDTKSETRRSIYDSMSETKYPFYYTIDLNCLKTFVWSSVLFETAWVRPAFPYMTPWVITIAEDMTKLVISVDVPYINTISGDKSHYQNYECY